MSNMKSE
jgi:hypothetical protein